MTSPFVLFNRVVVVLEQKIYVYNFQHLDLAESFVTIKNPLGLVSLSVVENACVLACPDEKIGHVKIVRFEDGVSSKLTPIKCHDSQLAALKLSQDGDFLVTASDKGTLIRVFSTSTGDKLNEVRRGADQAVITDLTIDPTNKFISCSSDKGTIHVFSLDKSDKHDEKNKKSALSALSGAVGYFGSNWSYAQFRVKDSSCKCAIIDGKIFAISAMGNYFMGDIAQGEIKIKKQTDLLEESNLKEDN